MTNQEEILYLTDLLLQATRWQVSEGECLDPLQLEVKDRLARLTGQCSINVKGVPSDKVEIAPKKDYRAKWSSERVRVKMEDGTWKWRLRTECEKVPVPGQRGKWKWAVKSTEKEETEISNEPLEDEHQCLSY